jgi:bloom syndrome protein
MIKDPRGQVSTQDSIDRQIENVRTVVQYCENNTECRRVQLMAFFGERFDKKSCKRGCDNCLNDTEMVNQDVTRDAKSAIELVRSLERSGRKVTTNQCQLIFKGSKATEPRKYGNERGYGSGSHLQKEVVELMFSKLLQQDVFSEYSVANGSGWYTQYLKASAVHHSKKPADAV